MNTKPISHSRTTITELMIPAYANFGGKIHGGILLSLMDKVAYACAAKHAGTYCVTVAIEGVEFLQPVNVGDLVSLHASVNYVGRSSLIIGIRVESENIRTGLRTHTNTSYFTMVAKGDDDKPTEVPALQLETRDDVRRFMESIKRRELKAAFKHELNNAKTTMEIHENLSLLEKERCSFASDWETR